MASPRGGFADKIGNRFEANYLVMAALGLLDGELRSLRWEGVGNEFEGIEYRSRLADGTTEAVQCKSNRDKAWTLAALASAGLLAAMRVQLTNGVDRFALILASKATDLHSLCQRARASASIGAFRQSLSGPLALQFERLLSFWNLSCTAEDQESARHWLSRIRVDEHCTPEYVDRAAERRCADLFEGPPGTTRAAIRDILEEHLGQEITADLLVSLLRSDRFKINPRDWGRLPDHVAGVQRLCDRFRSQLGRLLIRGQLIPRTESEAALKAIVDPAGPRTVLLHGGAGTGKSGVLYELAVRLAESGTCVIPLRLDNALPSGNLLRYSREMLGLPDTPGRCASRMSPGRRSVVMVDQLDAVRWAGVHSNSAWDVTLELLDEAMHTPDVSVVVACRTFDMKDDPNLRHWRSEQAIAGRIQEIEVKPLDDAIVSKALGHDGGVPPNKKQAGILRNPLMLSMWCELSDRGVDVRGISASSQLMSEHWKSVKRRLSDRHGMSDGTCEQAVDAIRAYLESQGRLDFPAQIVANQRALDALASESFLKEYAGPTTDKESESLPVRYDGPFKESKDDLIRAFEREYLTRLLAKTKGNIARTARDAGLDRKHLYSLLHKYGLVQTDDGLKGRFDGVVTFGSQIRSKDPQPDAYSSVVSPFVPGVVRGNLAGQNGGSDLNFYKGDQISTVLKGVFDLDVKKGNLGLFVRASAWKDFALGEHSVAYGNYPNGFTPNTPLGDRGFDSSSKFSNAEFRDYFVYGSTTLDDGKTLNLRLGRQVLTFVEAECAAMGVKALHLEVERTNTHAQAVYRRQGFFSHERYLMTKWVGEKSED